MPAVALLASTPKDRRAWCVGIRFHHDFCCDDACHCRPRHNPRFLVDHCRKLASGYRLRGPLVRRAEIRGQEGLNFPGTGGNAVLASCLLDQPHLCAAGSHMPTVMAAIGICYTLLAIRELWRGRGDGVWRWPIMLLLLGHAAAIPIQIPWAAWRHPDPADVDLLTFTIFETAFVCICAAYLFGGLAKDRIAAKLSARFAD